MFRDHNHFAAIHDLTSVRLWLPIGTAFSLPRFYFVNIFVERAIMPLWKVEAYTIITHIVAFVIEKLRCMGQCVTWKKKSLHLNGE
jgi:hypothetical protein